MFSFSNIIIIDPTIEEEDLGSAQITIVVQNNELCFVHKPGGTPIKDEELAKCIEISKKRGGIIENVIQEALKSLK